VELGLSAEDLVAVEEYASKLRHGIDPSNGIRIFCLTF
jgi:hypothetical protein